MRRALFCCFLGVSLTQIFQAQGLRWPTGEQSGTQNFAASDLSHNSDFTHLYLQNPGNFAVSDSSNGSHFAHLRLRNSPLPKGMRSFDPLTDEEEFCAHIRAYRVRREYQGSDVVTRSGYTTCVPSSRFEVRSAVMTQTEPSPGK